MKRFFYTLFAILAFVACSESDVDNGGNNGGGQTPSKQPEIILDTTQADFTTDGGSDEITFTSSAAWTAEVINSRADAWCSINPTSGEAGNAKITVTTTANDTPDDRTASIIIKAGSASKTINISQKQKDALTVTASKFEVGAEGGEVTIEVKANIDFEYAIEESAKEWITYQTTRAIKTSTLVFKVAENESEEKRECKIVIKSGEFNETVTIYQAGSTPTIILTKDKFSVPSAANTITVEVKSNVDVAVEMPDNAEWIKESTTRAFSTNTYNFDIEQNESYDNRTAEIKFTNKENDLYEVVTITQMQRDAIVVADSEYEIGINGGKLDFEIQTNVDIKVSISENAQSWIQQVETRGLETKALYFNIAACSAEEDREGTITISGGDATQVITIKQFGLKQTLAKEREVLIALYEATGGDNWTNNTNWCSEEPIENWHGIYVNANGSVRSIDLYNNNLTGILSDVDFSQLSQLKSLFLSSNALSGSIPTYLSQLSNLIVLDLGGNQLSGSIPGELSKLSKLKNLSLSGNNFSGTIPAELSNLSNLEILNLGQNSLSGSIPVELGQLSKLEYLYLDDNELSGVIPNELGLLSNLRDLILQYNQLSGAIPTELCQLSNLKMFVLDNNTLSGSIPPELGQLSNLECIMLNSNNLSGSIPAELGQLLKLQELYLQENELSGSIPSNLGNLKNLFALYLNKNYLSGDIPSSIMNLDCWNDCWSDILRQNGDGFNTDEIKIYAPEFSIPTIGGGVISNDFIAEHKYTVLYNFFEWCPFSDAFTPTLVSLYNKYKKSGLGIFSTTTDEESLVQTYINKHGINWPCTTRQDLWFGPFRPFMSSSPNVAVYDQNGLIVFNGVLTNYLELPAFLAKVFEDNSSESYESTDYSKDGEIKQLQTATKGEGIDIVLMGDAYSDRLIADGTYDNAMNTAMEKFFTEEPYKSFRDHFNVYSVNVVSKNEVYHDSSTTALESWFGEGTLVGGNDSKAFTYALKAISEERMDNAMVIVIMNDLRHAGTCYMYHPTNGDWGNGVSVSYFPAGASEESLGRLLHHEACGHGFAKLADEYAYQENGQIPDEEIESNKSTEKYGWWKNADFTNDPAKVKWTHFLNDSRYSNEGLGVYEGAFTYWTGAYRPTQNSIMNTNVGGFNAPSREAIYYRIHKLAYGANWEYDYEKFVEWDAKNRKAAATTRGIPYRLDIPKDYKPTHPPVVISKSWRDAK